MNARWILSQDAAEFFGWSIRAGEDSPSVAILSEGTRRIMVVFGDNDRIAYAEQWSATNPDDREQIKGGVFAVQKVMDR